MFDADADTDETKCCHDSIPNKKASPGQSPKPISPVWDSFQFHNNNKAESIRLFPPRSRPCRWSQRTPPLPLPKGAWNYDTLKTFRSAATTFFFLVFLMKIQPPPPPPPTTPATACNPLRPGPSQKPLICNTRAVRASVGFVPRAEGLYMKIGVPSCPWDLLTKRFWFCPAVLSALGLEIELRARCHCRYCIAIRYSCARAAQRFTCTWAVA